MEEKKDWEDIIIDEQKKINNKVDDEDVVLDKALEAVRGTNEALK